MKPAVASTVAGDGVLDEVEALLFDAAAAAQRVLLIGEAHQGFWDFEDCADLLAGFFQDLRQKKKQARTAERWPSPVEGA